MLPINHLEELLFLYSEHGKWDFIKMSENPSMSEHILETFYHKKWNYVKLSSNPAISLKFILNHPNKAETWDEDLRAWNEWNAFEFSANPSLDVNKIDIMISLNEMQQILCKFIPIHQLSGDGSIKKFVELHQYQYERHNTSAKWDVMKWFEPFQHHNEYNQSSIIKHIVKKQFGILYNHHLGSSLLYCLVKWMINHIEFDSTRFESKMLCCNIMHHSMGVDERFVALFEMLQLGWNNWTAFNNCISLECVADHHKLDHFVTAIIANERTCTNPSIVQSIYNLYHQIKNYYGDRKIPSALDDEELEQLKQMVKKDKLHLSIQTHIRDILSISPYNHIYYEDTVMFTPEQFIELNCLDIPLLKFSQNPHFDWEVLADWTWKQYEFESLSSNPFQHHLQYRKSKILYELAETGIVLKWNALNDLYYDDFDANTFLFNLKGRTSSMDEKIKWMRL